MPQVEVLPVLQMNGLQDHVHQAVGRQPEDIAQHPGRDTCGICHRVARARADVHDSVLVWCGVVWCDVRMVSEKVGHRQHCFKACAAYIV